MSNQFSTFKRFVSERYQERKAKHEGLGLTSPAFSAFIASYLTSHGFGEWLNTLRGLIFTEKQCHLVGATYVCFGQREYKDIPGILTHLHRYYDVNLPVIEGLLTPEYWQQVLTDEKEPAKTV